MSEHNLCRWESSDFTLGNKRNPRLLFTAYWSLNVLEGRVFFWLIIGYSDSLNLLVAMPFDNVIMILWLRFFFLFVLTGKWSRRSRLWQRWRCCRSSCRTGKTTFFKKKSIFASLVTRCVTIKRSPYE